MFRRTYIVGVFILTLLISGTSSGAVLNNRTGQIYDTIQGALDDCSPSDIIIVGDGIYTENIQINRENVTLMANRTGKATINAQNTDRPTVNITARKVVLNGFVITGNTGIFLKSTECRITDNRITALETGIQLFESSDNFISSNQIINCTLGIHFYNSSYNTISSNTLNSGGITLGSLSFNNTVSDNNLTNSSILIFSSFNTLLRNRIVTMGEGIYIHYADGNKLLNNTITFSGNGITLDASSYNLISGNTIANNTERGILIGKLSNNNKVSNNTIMNNRGRGIELSSFYPTSSNEISYNNIINNKVGLYIYGSVNNTVVYGNIFAANEISAENHGTDNIFNMPKPVGGNYWSDYNGVDSDRDGFGDTPYTFTGGTDNLPLIRNPARSIRIISIDPVKGAISVPRYRNITITFSSNITPGSAYSSITVKTSTGVLKYINKVVRGDKLIIVPMGGWSPGVIYRVTIPMDAIKTIDGATLSSDFSSSFTSAIAVTYIDPKYGATRVSRTKIIVITFSNGIIAGPAYSKITVKTSTGRLKSISKRIIGNRLYIKPVGSWRARTKYIVTVPRTAVKTSTGNMMAADFRSVFTTV
ncbi:right-handed parallel beta-helix repeat-containing protein [Methanothermobacter marburgensis]|uniref:Predicted cell surface glycoprotein n=1 Tax=Methanothermobacter marburgensis (strain ATCC BAA-927 / DSM 2133 / JCM 14651 / NBRC 100331 / OCM 82 / Marburg) TaxID=79929 RepID=D9PY98_METTM|nr:NosD domain-containing protein [Methanothermobacter marburgensis]ADL59196.1 predicted cell surface glycoprotein [Methanothermobacter marburgensis str. Marburg]WBF09702.1 right-handed parallel beta-helix repeat-containing protein [Methanothermobacter marburgensis]